MILKRLVKRTLEVLAEGADEQSVGAILKDGSVTVTNAKSTAGKLEAPSVDFRMQTARFLNELGMYKESKQILEGVIGDDSEQVEAWYLLAFAFFRLKKYATAEECCVSVRNLIISQKIVDPDLEAGTREIYEEILKWKAKQPK